MTYFGFLLRFLVVPILLLSLAALWDRRRPPASGLKLGAIWPAMWVLALAAVVYTAPWDNYLVATRTWWYDPSFVAGPTLGWVPIEEYIFFILQPILGGLWLAFLARRVPAAASGLGRPRLRAWLPAVAALLWLGALAALLAGWRPATYLALELGWALPPIAVQLAFGADILWRYRRVVLAALVPLTTYLAVADALAIGAGIWTIDPGQSLPFLVGGRLPIEEFVFFLLTNTLVAFGIVLLWAAESRGRFTSIRNSQLRSWLGVAANPQNATLAAPAADLGKWKLFEGEEHSPFFWEAGRPAALLIHGFLGSPAEMRPLGEALHRMGWTVQGVVLPGFAADIGRLFDCRYQDWIESVESTLATLQAAHRPVLLIGYSLGGTVALGVAARREPDGLVLLAPLWRMGTGWQRMVWSLARPFVPEFQPLKNADFSSPRLRHFLAGLMPQIDLDDASCQTSLRQIRFRTSLLDQLVSAGQFAWRSARAVSVPTLIVQGSRDETVRPQYTDRLRTWLPAQPEYLLVEAGHELLTPDGPAWSRLVVNVLAFASGIEPNP